ncbi:MAG: hypothetical protein ACP5O7_12610, partial [Phycisphaerae bacterium]
MTEAITTLNVPVVNQFGKPLGAEYNGRMVYEDGKAINVKINDGRYSDAVGVFTFPKGAQVPRGGPAEAHWLAGNPPAIPKFSTTQNIPV